MRKISIIFRVALTSVTAGMILSSCGVYDKYSRPEVDVEYVEEVSTAPWREVFTDGCLQALIDSALTNGTDLGVALLRVEEAEASLRRAELGFFPSVAASAAANPIPGSYSGGLTASWQVPLFGKIRNQKEYAKATLEERKAASEAVRSSLIAGVAASYYSLLLLDNQLEISLRTLDNWDKTLSVLEALKLAGKTNDIAILQAKAKRLNLESSSNALRKNVEIAQNNLCSLCGITPRAIPRGKLEDFSAHSSLTGDIPLRAVASRPDVRRAENVLAEAFYATLSARAAFYPDVTISVGGSWNSVSSLVWNVLGGLTAPIFSRGANASQLRIAQAQQEEARLSFRQTLLDAGVDVRNALLQYSSASESLETDTKQRDALSSAVEKIELMMKYSTTNYLEVLTAQQSLLDAELRLSTDYKNVIAAYIAIYQALGGGGTPD